jgi:hypothetical protein
MLLNLRLCLDCGAGSGGSAGMRRAARARVGKDACEGGSSRRRLLLASVLATRSSGSCGLEGGRRLVLRAGVVDGTAALAGEGAERADAERKVLILGIGYQVD